MMMTKMMMMMMMMMLVLSYFNETWIFSDLFSKIFKNQISRKFFPWEPRCTLQTDGQIGTMKLIVTFRNFAKALKNLVRTAQ